MDFFQHVYSYLQKESISKAIITLCIILLFWISNRLFTRVLEKQINDARSRYSWKKTSSYLLTFLALVIIGRIWLPGFHQLATYLGLLSAGIAIALKDLIANLAGWLFILWRKPFEVGHRIQIGNNIGDVIDLRPFQFTLLEVGNWVRADQSTGRLVHVPNNLIFTNPLFNYNSEFKYIWNEIPVLITFESDWQKTKSILLKIANDSALEITDTVDKEIKQAARKFLIYYNNITPAVYTSVSDSGVLLTIRYLVDVKERRSSTESIWEAILLEFARHDDITLAYPTMRVMAENEKKYNGFNR